MDAAVDHQIGPVDEGGVVGDQEQTQRSHVGRFPVPAGQALPGCSLSGAGGRGRSGKELAQDGVGLQLRERRHVEPVVAKQQFEAAAPLLA